MPVQTLTRSDEPLTAHAAVHIGDKPGLSSLGRETIRLKSQPWLVAIAVISALYDKDQFLPPPVAAVLSR